MLYYLEIFFYFKHCHKCQPLINISKGEIAFSVFRVKELRSGGGGGVQSPPSVMLAPVKEKRAEDKHDLEFLHRSKASFE